MSKVLIPAQTAAVDVNFSINSDKDLPCGIVAAGMASGDTIDVQVSHDKGQTYEDLYYDGTQVQLSYQSQNMIGFYTPGLYRIQKPTTTGQVSVVQTTTRNP